MPIYSILECFHGAAGTSFFLEFMSPFLTQGWIPSWLPFAYSAAVLAFPTRAFQSLYFTISLPKPSWIFLSRGWDLAHCHFSSDFAHLLCLNPLVDLGKRGCLWQFLPRTHKSKARHLTFPFGEQWLEVQAGKSNLLSQMHHLLPYELWKVF